MANLLLDPNLWQDVNDTSPPSYWTGSVYALSVDDYTAARFGLQAGSGAPTPSPGDIVAGRIDFADRDSNTTHLNYYTLADGVLETVQVISGSWAQFSFTAVEGGAMALASSDSSLSANYYYGLDVTITPFPDPDPPPEPVCCACKTIGRVFRAIVSAFTRGRAQVGRVRRQERQTVVADFNGAIPAERTIASVTWRCVAPWVLKMSDAAISENRRAVCVLADFQFGGFAALRATVTLDDGSILSQAFEYTVVDSPWFVEDGPIAAGPFTLTASAT